MPNQAANEVEVASNPFSVFGPAPYTLVGVCEKVHPVAGYDISGEMNPSMGFRAGGSCDLCAMPIRWAYNFQAGNGCRFTVGCECALKAQITDGSTLRNARRDYERTIVVREAARARAEREAAERLANQASGKGAFTHRELAEAEEEERFKIANAAAEQRDRVELARRTHAPYVGEVGTRYAAVVTLTFVKGMESQYGIFWIECYRTANGSTLVYKGGTRSAVRVGETAEICFGVKAQSEYTHNDRIGGTSKQTIIEQLKTLEILEATPEAHHDAGKNRLVGTRRVGTNGSYEPKAKKPAKTKTLVFSATCWVHADCIANPALGEACVASR